MRTDYSYFLSLGSYKDSIYYEKRLEVVKTPKVSIMTDNLITLNINYKIEDKYVVLYNKIDTILANSFSMLEVLFFIFSFISAILKKNAIEYKIINNLYYNTKENKSNVESKEINISKFMKKENKENIVLNKDYKESVNNMSLKSLKSSESIKIAKLDNLIRENKLNTNFEKIKYSKKRNAIKHSSNNSHFEYFAYIQGIRDLIKTFKCIKNEEESKILKLQNKSVELAQQEMDLMLISVKLIQNEYAFNKLMNSNENMKCNMYYHFFSKNVIYSKRNLLNIDNLIKHKYYSLFN